MGVMKDLKQQQDAKRRGNGAKATKTDEPAQFRGFVNVDLTKEEKEAFDSWALTDKPWIGLERMVADGQRVGVKVDRDGSTVLATSFDQRALSPNGGLIATGRAGDPGKALFRLVYIVTEVLGANWEDRGTTSDPDRW